MSMNTWQPTGFSAGEFARMQQDAERRVEEMRRRARLGPEQLAEPEPPPEGAALGTGEGFLLLAALRDGENLPLALALFWLLG